MATNWNEARLDRLSERIDLIERERREERQRALDRGLYTMLAIIWLIAIAMIVLASIKAAS